MKTKQVGEVQVTSRMFAGLEKCDREIKELLAKDKMSKLDESKFVDLTSRQKFLQKGLSPDEIKAFQRSQLLKEAGIREARQAKSPANDEREVEFRAFASGQKTEPTRTLTHEQRAEMLAGQESITYTQGAAGGTWVDETLHDNIFEVMRAYDAIFDPAFSNIVETATGSNAVFPIVDDVENASTLIGEGQPTSEVVPVMGAKQLGAYKFATGKLPITLELLEDSNWPLLDVVSRIFALRHARGVGAYLINGTGTDQPTGLVTGAVGAGASIIAAAGSATNTGGGETGLNSIGSSDLNSCYQTLNRAYRPFSAWAMNDDVLNYLAGILDKSGRPIVSVRKGLDDSDVYVILGRPVAVCPSMPGFGSGNNPVCLYSVNHFVVRQVPSATYIRVFSQLPNYIESGMVAMQSFARIDSNLMSADSAYVPASLIQTHS